MRSVVHVVRSPNGSWDVRTSAGAVIARHVSEIDAWQAARAAAGRLAADLVFHRDDGPATIEVFGEPPRQAAQADPPVTRPAIRSRQTRRRLILLVEDLLDAREMYAEYLSYSGFGVVTAINGHEAVRVARLLRPDVILMDVRLPGMDGLEATADLKADPELAHIPVVAITADSSHEISARAMAVGCAAFIVKPAFPDEVERRIRWVLGDEQSDV